MECGVVKEENDYSFKFISHLIDAGKTSFESKPFKVKKIIIKLENFIDNKNNISYCLVKLKGDEYWKYTKPGKYNDFFTFEYLDQDTLIIKSFDGNNNSEENSIDITEFTDNKERREKIISNSCGKYKLTFYEEIKFNDSPSVLTFTLFLKYIPDIKKEKDILWLIEVNNQSTGYTYDGIFDKYFQFPVNSLLSDSYNLVLYKEEKGKKKEYAKKIIYISQFKIGLNYENTIFFKNYQLHYKAFISLPNKNPFVIEECNPLIIHICAIEAYNIPKSDPYVLCRLERDQSGVTTKYLEKTSKPQWYEFIHLIITDENEDLVVEIWNKNGKKDKLICGSKLNLKKYLNGEIYYE